MNFWRVFGLAILLFLSQTYLLREWAAVLFLALIPAAALVVGVYGIYTLRRRNAN